MKNKKKLRQTHPKSTIGVLAQVCKLIPGCLVAKVARAHGCDRQARKFSPWSHVVSLIYAQLTRCLSLNDVCDSLQNHRGQIAAIRAATPPNRNTFSNANRQRDPKMAEDLFWSVLNHFQNLSPEFGARQRYGKLPPRFKRAIYSVDSTVIQLVANCIDWAKHRRRKAAAKCHMRLNMQNMLPSFALVDTAKDSDAKRARELCAGLKDGEIVVFDKAYIDFDHLHDLKLRSVFWVTRTKTNMKFRVVRKRLKKPEGKILRDDEIILTCKKSRKSYPARLRRVRAIVEVDGKEREMEFITNNMDWAPSSVCDLYRCRWSIEVFFKQLKQTLQLCDFIGHNEKAVKWQIWTALLTYVILRFLAHLSQWNHSLSRIWTMIRGVIWERIDLLALLRSYGTAGGCYRALGAPQDAYLPGLAPS